MKSDRIQKHKTKERHKGLRASDFLDGRRIDTPEGPENWGFQDTWPVAALLRDAKDHDFSTQEEPALNNHHDILGWSVSLMAASPVARLLLKEAASEGWSFGIADLNGHDFHLDVPEKQIILDDAGLMPSALGRSAYFLNVLKISMIRALRDVWQEKRHGGFDEQYGPEAILMLERVRAADCDVLATAVSWELRSEGHNELWRYLVGSTDGDIAMAYCGRLERDPSSQFSGAALAAAFDQWFRDIHRVNACDHEALEYLDDVIRGGGSFGTKKLTRVGVEVLSCMPDKTAYLRGRGHDLLTDPFFAGLHDEINQSHFLQVMYDMKVTYVHGVPFSNSALADKIFPDGLFTRETETTPQKH